MVSFFHFSLLSLCFFVNSCWSAASTRNLPILFVKRIHGSCQMITVNRNQPKCLECNISSLPQINSDQQYKGKYTCMILYFSNNAIFEKFVKNNKEEINNLFVTNKTQPINNTFFIILQKMNQTKIDAVYINKIFGEGTKPYHLLDIKILNYTEKQKPLQIENDFKKINISQFFIHIPCNHSNGTIHYNITSKSVTYKEDLICQNSTRNSKQNVSTTRLFTTRNSTPTATATQKTISTITTMKEIEELTTFQTTVSSTTLLQTIFEVKPMISSVIDSTKITTDKIYSEESSSYSTADLLTTTILLPTTELLYASVNSSEVSKSHQTINPTSDSSTISTEPSQRSTKRFLVFLLFGLAVLSISASLIVTYLVLKCRPKPVDLINENSSELFDISKVPSVLDSSNISPSFSRGNQLTSETNTRTFNDDF